MHTPRLTVQVSIAIPLLMYGGKRCANIPRNKVSKVKQEKGVGYARDLLDHCTVQHITVQHSLAFECVCILSD